MEREAINGLKDIQKIKLPSLGEPKKKLLRKAKWLTLSHPSIGYFRLSHKAEQLLKEKGFDTDLVLERHDPLLVAVVEELGEEAYDHKNSRLRIKEVSGSYYIDYDDDPGYERVVEQNDIAWK